MREKCDNTRGNRNRKAIIHGNFYSEIIPSQMLRSAGGRGERGCVCGELLIHNYSNSPHSS